MTPPVPDHGDGGCTKQLHINWEKHKQLKININNLEANQNLTDDQIKSYEREKQKLNEINEEIRIRNHWKEVYTRYINRHTC